MRRGKRLGRLLGRLARARVNGRDRLPAQLVNQRLDFLPAILAQRNVERSLHATLLVVFSTSGANQKYLNHKTNLKDLACQFLPSNP